MQSNKNRGKYVDLVGIFMALCVFFYFVPYTDDDLRWGSQVGLERLSNGFSDYGGRYLGYLIVMGLTRSVVFKVLFMSGTIALIAYLIRYITKLQLSPYITILFIMLAPLPLFSTTIGWVSGFANYVTSVCFTLIYIAYLTYFKKQEIQQHSVVMTILLFLLGVVNALVVEHFTIYNVLLSIFILGLCVAIYKKVFAQFVGYALGCISGAVWMFSNSAYHNILGGSDSYRNTGSDGMIMTIATGLAKICKFGYMDNIFLNIAILMAFWLVVSEYQSKLDIAKQRVVKGCLMANLVYVIGSCFMSRIFDGITSVDMAVYLIIVITSLLNVFAQIIIVLIFSKYYYCFKMILFLFISIVIIDAPFLVANPVTPRVFFGTYILFIIMLCVLMKEICCEIKAFHERDMAKICKTGVIVGACFYCAIFFVIQKEDRERLQSIKSQISEGNKKVTMYAIPYEQFVHDITLYEKWELDGYKEFYELPEDLEFVVEEKTEKSEE